MRINTDNNITAHKSAPGAAAEWESGRPAEISAAQCILESAWVRVAFATYPSLAGRFAAHARFLQCGV
jgi:flagellum-specific peptidoglycan hydrolase FlgJ